jgi:uncharacterized protein YciI
MKTYILQYTYVEGILEKRAPVRPAHLEHVMAHREKGKYPFVAVGGALPAEDPTSAILVFKAESAAVSTAGR